MARIIDKATRLIDIDFGAISVAAGRNPGDGTPTTVTTGLNGVNQVIRLDTTSGIGGSFVQYSRIDLDFMTMNNEVVLPTEVSVQRTSPVPLGSSQNGNNFDQIEEYIYVFTRPLNNKLIESLSTPLENFRDLGLDRSQTINTNFGGDNAGIPDHQQCVYAEKRMYSYNESLMATVNNGELIVQTPPAAQVFNTLAGMPVLDSITTWGTMGTITGPNLHCYRVVINRTQVFPTTDFTNVPLAGATTLRFPPVNITFVCTDPRLTEGEYLTRLANAMNSIPIDGDTA